MFWLTFNTETEAAAAAAAVYAVLARNRAAENDGFLYDHVAGIDVDVTTLPDTDLAAPRFPLWGRRASDQTWQLDHGNTTAWAIPQQITDGRWVIPSLDNTGEEAQPEWWPRPPEMTAAPDSQHEENLRWQTAESQ